MLAHLYKAFNPDQPRDDHGRWAAGAGSQGGGTDPNQEHANYPGLTDTMRGHALAVAARVSALGPDYTQKTYDAGKYGPDAWSPEREALHDQYLDEQVAAVASVPAEHRAMILGGISGAGKSSMLASEVGRALGVQTDATGSVSNYAVVNPDEAKSWLLAHGGGVPVEGAQPAETVLALHEESSAMASDLAETLMGQGKNVLWDITMSSVGSVQRRIDDLRAAGYQVDGAFVNISVGKSLQRVMGRYSHGYQDYQQGKGLGGRFVPPSVVLGQADTTGAWPTKNRGVFETLKDHFDHATVIENEHDERRITERRP